MRLFEKPLTNPETALRRLDEYSSLINEKFVSAVFVYSYLEFVDY